MTDEERAKQYRDQREAEDLCDAAHYAMLRYLRTIGQAARYDRLTAASQLERDIGLQDDRLIRELAGGKGKEDYENIVNRLVDKGIDLAKRDPETGYPIPSASGFSMDEDATGGFAWAVFNKKDLPSDIEIDDDDLAYKLTGWQYYYGGPGRSFSHEPWAHVSRSRILVKQQRGLDI